MTEAEHPPGPLEDQKHGQTADPGRPQPEASEVESARLLANQAREELEGDGVSWTEIRRLADAYIAEDRGTDLPGFLEWARARVRSGRT